MAQLSMIVAMDNNNAIGRYNQLLWHIPEDLAHFKRKTERKIVIMGRKTYDSIGRPLPNRRNVIVTRNKEFIPQGAILISSIEDLTYLLHSNNNNIFVVNDFNIIYEMFLHTEEEIFIIGGSTLYNQFINVADTLHITEVDCSLNGDTFFPEIPEIFKLTSSRGSKNAEFNYSFNKYERT